MKFVDTTKKQNKYFKKIIFLIAIIMFLFFFCFLNIRMNNSFYLQQLSETVNLDSTLISHQYKPNSIDKFMQIKFGISKMKQSEIADQLG